MLIRFDPLRAVTNLYISAADRVPEVASYFRLIRQLQVNLRGSLSKNFPQNGCVTAASDARTCGHKRVFEKHRHFFASDSLLASDRRLRAGLDEASGCERQAGRQRRNDSHSCKDADFIPANELSHSIQLGR